MVILFIFKPYLDIAVGLEGLDQLGSLLPSPRHQHGDKLSKRIVSPFYHPSFDLKNGTITHGYTWHTCAGPPSATTLQTYFKMLAEESGWWEYDVQEGGMFAYPGTHPTSSYVTHLRDLYERSTSHFKYGQRWGCGKLTNGSFNATYENANNLT
jgi:hypothetical protein